VIRLIWQIRISGIRCEEWDGFRWEVWFVDVGVGVSCHRSCSVLRQSDKSLSNMTFNPSWPVTMPHKYRAQGFM
jgi:hypothetical protein